MTKTARTVGKIEEEEENEDEEECEVHSTSKKAPWQLKPAPKEDIHQ